MTLEARLAYLNSQLACAMIECAAMQVANTERLLQDKSIAYNEGSFMELIDKYGLHQNTVLDYLRD